MGRTAEEKVRARYHQQLMEDKEPRPITDVNRAILEQIRAEIAAVKKTLQASGQRREAHQVQR